MADKMLEANEQARQKAAELHRRMRESTAEIHREHPCPAIRFTLERGEPGIFESKVGGTPYLPHDMDWPLDGEGQVMDLLAQIDCAGLAGLPDFPTAGLLQFFLARDDVYGMDFDEPATQKGFRVLYHETVDQTVTAGEVQAKRPAREDEEDWNTPLGNPSRICLQPVGEQGMNEQAPQFKDLFAQKWNARWPEMPIEDSWDVYQQIPNRLRDYNATEDPAFSAPYHQLGGWPYFTQDDPRLPEGPFASFDTLLFQLDSDLSEGERDLVLWGDSGVGNFFISREDLKQRDFSRILYHWDCC